MLEIILILIAIWLVSLYDKHSIRKRNRKKRK
jgi:hypothetical protein